MPVAGDSPKYFRLWLWCFTFGTFPAFATLGVGIIGQGFVVVAIDSQITNALSGRLECKMSHNGTTAIIASGTYRFYSVTNGRSESGFGILEAEKESLSVSRSPKSVFSHLVSSLETQYPPALLRYFIDDHQAYFNRYRDSPVGEFIVAGFDSAGPWLGRVVFQAPIPAELTNKQRIFEVPRTGLTKIGIVPDVRMDRIVTETFWSIKVAPNESVESAVVEKARRFIKLGMKVLPGVSEPITIAVINRAGFRFADKGSCESGAQ